MPMVCIKSVTQTFSTTQKLLQLLLKILFSSLGLLQKLWFFLQVANSYVLGEIKMTTSNFLVL